LGKINIQNLDLFVRTYNCLKNENLKTLDEVLMIFPHQLSQIKNWGKKSTRDIQKCSAKKLGIEIGCF